MVRKKVFRCLEPFRRGSRVTYRQTDILIANAALTVAQPKLTQYVINERISVSRLSTY